MIPILSRKLKRGHKKTSAKPKFLKLFLVVAAAAVVTVAIVKVDVDFCFAVGAVNVLIFQKSVLVNAYDFVALGAFNLVILIVITAVVTIAVIAVEKLFFNSRQILVD